MAAVPAGALDAASRADALWPKYAEEVDRDSARERLAGRLAESAAAEAADEEQAEVRRQAPPKQPRGSRKADESPVTSFLKSREGRQMANTVVRGVFARLRKRR
jgi:hypothetical protein